ncbi:MAG TPA: thioredoxin domain-containing protein [Conexibacter sp.]|jgi:protein-disulfide isomerase
MQPHAGVLRHVFAALVLAASVAALALPTTASASATSEAFLAGIPQHGATLGDPKAPYLLTEYVDLQCPFCAEWAREVLPTVVDRYVRTGEARIDLHLVSFIGNDSVTAARFAVAARLQDLAWSMSVRLLLDQREENTGYVTSRYLRREGAKVAGLDVAAAVTASRARAVARVVRRETRSFLSNKRLTGVPSMVLSRRGSRPRLVAERNATSRVAVVRALDRLIRPQR